MNTRTLLAATLTLTTLASSAAMAAEPAAAKAPAAAAAKAPSAAATSPMKGATAHRHASHKAHAVKAAPAKS